MVIVRIKVFKGEALTLNADGSVKNENWIVTFNEREFEKYLKYVKAQGFCKVELVGTYDIRMDSEGKQYLSETMLDIKKKHEKALNDAFYPKEEVKPDLESLTKRLEILEQENKELKDRKLEAPTIVVEGHKKPLPAYNKAELIQYGSYNGIELTEDMSKNDMLAEIKKHKKT